MYENEELSIEVLSEPPTLSSGVRTRLEETHEGLGLAPGTRIRHYELIRKVGEGGMGVVFLARDVKLGRRVAMKFVAAPSAEGARRFVAEARATATCHHENIVIIYEVDAHHGTPYMVLEYIEGRTLGHEIGRSSVPAARAVELIIPVVKALICAHDHGIVHRDLKMGNILVTTTGVVKVVDFGVAKVVADPGDDARIMLFPDSSADSSASGTQQGLQVGTPSYMAPEQLSSRPIDHRVDIWSLGIILHRMVTGRHPIAVPTKAALLFSAGDLDTPFASVRTLAPQLPHELAQIIDRCLEKRVERRWPEARSLLAALERLLPAHHGRTLAIGECPYPGLSAFEESDADRFFGRHRDTLRAVTRLRERPLLGVVGPSGVGKSSFVRAGVIPALKASEPWTVMILRPGRAPIANLASQLRAIGTVPPDLEHRLRTEAGLLGSLLREQANRTGTKLVLVVDQFEELYTLVPDAAERIAVTAALAGVADDPSSPVRVVVSLRSDFLDRVDEDRRFADDLLRGTLLLSPPSRDDLREVLVRPLVMVGHRFEDDAIVDEMLASLETTAGALPLLQFTASRLWDARDPGARILTSRAYHDIGGVAGALATHADEVIHRLGPLQQRLAQAVFQRLVTPERTRAVVEHGELESLARDPQDVYQLVNYLAAERLLVVHTRGAEDGATVEIVHESLVTKWPTLRRWLEETHEDSAFVAQLAVAAKSWHDHGRSVGLLWRGDAAEEARRWRKRSEHVLGTREAAYLRAVVALAERSVRIRRTLVVGTIGFLVLLVASAAVALLWIRRAEQRTAEQAIVARSEAEKARAAQTRVIEQLALVQAKERERQGAVSVAEHASIEVSDKKQELKAANEKLVKALKVAQTKGELAARESEKAQRESDRARAAAQKLEVLLAKDRERIRELERERSRITEKLR